MGDGDKLSIVTMIFPEYDWVREILGDKAGDANVTMFLDNGVDLHSYSRRQTILSGFPPAICLSMRAANRMRG